jgi:heat shock protein HtpX
VVVVLVGAAVGLLFGNGPVFTIAGARDRRRHRVRSYWKADKIALRGEPRPPGRPRTSTPAAQPGRGAVHRERSAQARRLRHRRPGPQRLRHRPQPAHAAIAVTTGLLEKMNRVELEGVVAHELSHIKNYDILVSTLAVTMVGCGRAAGRPRDPDDVVERRPGPARRRPRRQWQPARILGFALLILAAHRPRDAGAISRQRETLADVSACQMTRYPPGLISALEKLQDDTTVTHSASTATAHLWIEQPMSGVGDERSPERPHRWFDTHPPLDERIALLREL